MENKVCKRCNMNLPLSEYYKPKNGLYYNSKCKKCHREEYREEYRETKGVEVAERKRLKRAMLEEKGVKVCLTCNIELPLSSYQFNMGKYYSSDCKSCRSTKEKEKKLKKRMESGYVNKHELAIQSGVKICDKCKLELPLTDYYKKGKNGLECICKKCKSEKNKVYMGGYLNDPINKQKIRDTRKRYEKKKALENRLKKEKLKEEALLLLNIEKERKRQEFEKKEFAKKEIKKLAKEERDRINAYKNTDEYKIEQKKKDNERRYLRWKNKWANDELFAIRQRLRTLVRNSFRKSGYNKFEMKTEAIVGITYKEFKQYMESKFQDGMSWDNRGEWHIDHMIPLSSAKSEEELIALSHYTNLQPLWAIDNLKKGSKLIYTEEELMQQLNIISEHKTQKALSVPQSNVRGYYYKDKKYVAKIKINKETIYLGRFDTPEEASEAYQKALRTPQANIISEYKKQKALRIQQANVISEYKKQKALSVPQSNVRGYYYNKRDKKYVAKIGLEGKKIYLGRFDTPGEASEAYQKARLIYHV